MTIQWGLTLPSPMNTATYKGLTVPQRDIGLSPALVGWFRSWRSGGVYAPFDVAMVDYIRSKGATSVVCWQPMDSTGPVMYIDAGSILRGEHDAYITQWARDAAAWGGLLYLRVLHEFDGDWYPWSLSLNGWTPDTHIEAWRRIVTIFRAVGAFNVRFVWCSNRVDADNAELIEAAYPGDDWVHLLGVDGYNFGTALGHQWQTVEQVFDATLSLSGLFPRLAGRLPVLICEVGCVEGPNPDDKASWISHLYGYALKTRYPNVAGVCWMQDSYSEGAGRDNTIQSSPQALAAFRSAVALSAYQGAQAA